MPELLINILYPLISVFALLSIIINFTFFTLPRKKCLMCFTFILYIILTLLHALDMIPLANFSLLMSIIIYLYLTYRRISITIVLSVLISSFIILCDAISGFIFLYIFNYSYSDIICDSILYFKLGLMFSLLCYILSKISRIIILRVTAKPSNHFEISQNHHVLFIIAPITLMALFSLYIYFIKQYLKTLDKFLISIYTISSLLLLLSAILLAYYDFVILINQYKSKELIQLKKYTEMIENMFTDLRSFKHDYLNILSTIETFIQNQDLNGLKNYYYNDLLPDSNKILKKDISLSRLSLIDISPLKALLSYKIITAHSKGINVKIEVSDKINSINISVVDICRIIGILLDNAIEGSILCEKKCIYILIIETDTAIIFNIQNTCLNSTPSVCNIYKKNFSTKGKGRGVGLKTIRKLINNYYKNILLNTSIENCIFKQELIINKK